MRAKLKVFYKKKNQVFDNKYLKTNMKSCKDRITTNFHNIDYNNINNNNNKVSKEGSE